RFCRGPPTHDLSRYRSGTVGGRMRRIVPVAAGDGAVVAGGGGAFVGGGDGAFVVGGGDGALVAGGGGASVGGGDVAAVLRDDVAAGFERRQRAQRVAQRNPGRGRDLPGVGRAAERHPVENPGQLRAEPVLGTFGPTRDRRQ